MPRWWKTLGRTDQIALIGIVVTLIGILPTYLVFFEDDNSEPTPPTTSIALTKLVTDTSQALTIRIPQDWGHVRAGWSFTYQKKQDIGAGIRVGSGPGLRAEGVNFSDPSIYVGASSQFAKRLEFAGRSESDLAGWALATQRLIDWSKEECTLVSERDPAIENYVGVLRVWEGCNGLAGSHVLDYIGVSRDGDAVLSSDALLPPNFPEHVVEDIIQSVIVREERLPAGEAGTPSGSTLEVPRPSWLQASATTSADSNLP